MISTRPLPRIKYVTSFFIKRLPQDPSSKISRLQSLILDHSSALFENRLPPVNRRHVLGPTTGPQAFGPSIEPVNSGTERVAALCVDFLLLLCLQSSAALAPVLQWAFHHSPPAGQLLPTSGTAWYFVNCRPILMWYALIAATFGRNPALTTFQWETSNGFAGIFTL